MDTEADPAKVHRFEEQVLVHLDDLYRAALRLTGSALDAEDLAQETCLRAFQALDQLRHPAAAKVWVFAILRSVFLRQAKRQSTQAAPVTLEDLESGLVVAQPTFLVEHGEASPVRATLLGEIRQATLKLPVPYREAIILAHIGGFSYREMAQILEVPVGTVMSRLHRGRRLLRALLHEAVASDPRLEPAQ